MISKNKFQILISYNISQHSVRTCSSIKCTNQKRLSNQIARTSWFSINLKVNLETHFFKKIYICTCHEMQSKRLINCNRVSATSFNSIQNKINECRINIPWWIIHHVIIHKLHSIWACTSSWNSSNTCISVRGTIIGNHISNTKGHHCGRACCAWCLKRLNWSCIITSW